VVVVVVDTKSVDWNPTFIPYAFTPPTRPVDVSTEVKPLSTCVTVHTVVDPGEFPPAVQPRVDSHI
jgi:hypothetical protein